jgi:hypothetical protein
MENLAECLEVDVSALIAKKVVISMRQGDLDRFFDTPIVKLVLPRKIHKQKQRRRVSDALRLFIHN